MQRTYKWLQGRRCAFVWLLPNCSVLEGWLCVRIVYFLFAAQLLYGMLKLSRLCADLSAPLRTRKRYNTDRCPLSRPSNVLLSLLCLPSDHVQHELQRWPLITFLKDEENHTYCRDPDDDEYRASQARSFILSRCSLQNTPGEDVRLSPSSPTDNPVGYDISDARNTNLTYPMYRNNTPFPPLNNSMTTFSVSNVGQLRKTATAHVELIELF